MQLQLIAAIAWIAVAAIYLHHLKEMKAICVLFEQENWVSIVYFCVCQHEVGQRNSQLLLLMKSRWLSPALIDKTTCVRSKYRFPGKDIRNDNPRNDL